MRGELLLAVGETAERMGEGDLAPAAEVKLWEPVRCSES